MKGPKLRNILHSSSERLEHPYTGAKGAVNAKYTLTAHLWSYLQAYADKHREADNGFGKSCAQGIEIRSLNSHSRGS